MNHYYHADILTKALAERHKDDVFMTQVRTGPTQTAAKGEQRILDAVGIKRSWSQPLYHGYEIKVSRSDFKKDDKWPLYLDFCHSLSFVCPKDMIALDELPENIGIIYHNEATNQLRTVRKAAYRPIEIPRSMLEYIIMAKVDSDRHPFFSDDRAYMEAWVQDRNDRLQLGYKVRGKLHQKIVELDQAKQELERKQMHVEVMESQFNDLQNEMARYGIHLERWGWKEELRSALEDRYSSNVEEQFTRLQKDLARLQKQVIALH